MTHKICTFILDTLYDKMNDNGIIIIENWHDDWHEAGTEGCVLAVKVCIDSIVKYDFPAMPIFFSSFGCPGISRNRSLRRRTSILCSGENDVDFF